MKRLLFVILLTIMGCCGVHVQAVGYEKIINPVLPGDRPPPTVIEINGEYWYWYKVDYPSLPDGWVYGKYLDIEK